MPRLGGPQPTHGRTQVGLRVIPERHDELVALEDGLHDAALHASAPAVDEADLNQAAFVGRPQVLFDDRRDVPRLEGVKVELGLDGDDVGIGGHGRHVRLTMCDGHSLVDRRSSIADLLLYSATTVVVMPPRAVNAPVTVMRRGAQAATRS
ncbi:MAG TPA: hypothetical protein VIX35_07365, partial [Vicinamibacterales bacterium]